MIVILVLPTSGHGSRVRNPLEARFRLQTVTALHFPELMFNVPKLRFTEILSERTLIPNHLYMCVKKQNANVLDVSCTYYTHFPQNMCVKSAFTLTVAES